MNNLGPSLGTIMAEAFGKWESLAPKRPPERPFSGAPVKPDLGIELAQQTIKTIRDLGKETLDIVA